MVCARQLSMAGRLTRRPATMGDLALAHAPGSEQLMPPSWNSELPVEADRRSKAEAEDTSWTGGRVRVSVVARREGDFVVHVRVADSGSRGDVLVAVSP